MHLDVHGNEKRGIMVETNTTRAGEIGSYHMAHGSSRKRNFITCDACYKEYIEDLICQDKADRLDFCIRCYNERNYAEENKS